MVNRLAAAPLCIACIACGGPNEETLVDELRVLSIVTEPPEVAPGDSVTLQHLTHIPDGTGAERLVWTCTFDGTGCAESQFATQIDDWVHLVEPNGTELQTHDLMVPSALGAALSDELPQIQLPLWTLACAPGLCPIIDAVRQSPTPGTDEWIRVSDALANPFEWMNEYPKKGVSLATKAVTVSLAPQETRNTNPTITRDTIDPITVLLEESTPLTFTVSDDDPMTTFAYTTIGGFESTSESVSSGPVTQTLFAPTVDPEERNGRIYIVVNDSRGGSAIWTESFTLVE